MDAYLAKPVAIERLRATLERWLAIVVITGLFPSAARPAMRRHLSRAGLRGQDS
jgi:hypothetical protein